MCTLGIDVAKRRRRATLLDDDGQTVFSHVAGPWCRRQTYYVAVKLGGGLYIFHY